MLTLTDSRRIVEDWCELHDFDMDKLVDAISDIVFRPNRNVVFTGCKRLTGEDIIISSVLQCSEYVVDSDVRLYKQSGYPHITIRERIPIHDNEGYYIALLSGDCDYNDDDEYFALTDQCFAWYDETRLNCELWKRRCFGCTINHPSQVQHMGGCLPY